MASASLRPPHIACYPLHQSPTAKTSLPPLLGIRSGLIPSPRPRPARPPRDKIRLPPQPGIRLNLVESPRSHQTGTRAQNQDAAAGGQIEARWVARPHQTSSYRAAPAPTISQARSPLRLNFLRSRDQRCPGGVVNSQHLGSRRHRLSDRRLRYLRLWRG